MGKATLDSRTLLLFTAGALEAAGVGALDQNFQKREKITK